MVHLGGEAAASSSMAAAVRSWDLTEWSAESRVRSNLQRIVSDMYEEEDIDISTLYT